jgi:hypothetical protein
VAGLARLYAESADGIPEFVITEVPQRPRVLGVKMSYKFADR